MSAHLWVAGPHQAPDPDADIVADCHRRRRGPYSGLGDVLCALVPETRSRWPELVRAHAIEILTIAPQLKDLVDAAPATLASLAVPEERTRIYPRVRTGRIAHGAVDFLAACTAPDRLGRKTVALANVDFADPTDQEFLAIALRRAHADRLRLIVKSRGEELPSDLAEALARYADRAEASICAAPADGPRADGRGEAELVRAYVESDGTSLDPAEVAAYERAGRDVTAPLHDARLARLRSGPEPPLPVGAVAYHLEHGCDPVAASEGLWEAVEYCMVMGFYEGAIDYGRRGRSVTDPDTQMQRYWYLTGRTATALAVIGRPEEAEPLYLELRSRYSLPKLQMVNSYALGMLYTRYHSAENKDHDLARAYVNTAIAIASLWPEPEEKAFHYVFNRNGLALIEMHLNRLEDALEMVTAGLDELNRELPEDKHILHKSVLVYNRASLLARLGRLDEALAAYTAVIEVDPNWADYYFERADIRRRLGDPAGALADYDMAMTITPPFWELHYNRADLRRELGDTAGAIYDLGRVTEIEPGELDARINLVDLLIEAGDLAGASSHLDQGLRHHPEDPQLLCAQGQLHLEAGELQQARQSFDRALLADPGMVQALAGRATVAYDTGDYEAAAEDLTSAIALAGDDPDLLYNRGQAYQAARRWQAAIGDFSAALHIPGADRGALLDERGRCYAEIGDITAWQADAEAARQVQDAVASS